MFGYTGVCDRLAAAAIPDRDHSADDEGQLEGGPQQPRASAEAAALKDRTAKEGERFKMKVGAHISAVAGRLAATSKNIKHCQATPAHICVQNLITVHLVSLTFCELFVL